MGSALLRDKRTISESGSTLYKGYNTPTLTLMGLKDGLMRISRGAEAFWHQEENIDDTQKGMFPVIAIDKASHSSFLDRTMPLPSFVASKDLNPELDQAEGYEMISKSMISFMSGVLGDTSLEETMNALKEETKTLLQPLMDGMKLEAGVSMKPPCYAKPLINPDDNTCMHGSEWSETAQTIMGGDIAQWNADITTDDNFHVVSDTHPVHLPTITNKCDGVTACTLDTITVTENYYDILNQFDTGESPIGAFEQKHKIKSRQAVQEAASGKDADFHETDEVGNRCGDINQESLNWALANASPEALERYNSVGKKLVIGDDKGPYNAGPLWIWTYMAYKDNKDKTETLV